MVSLRFLVASAISIGAPLVSALTAQEIVNNINTLTTKSQALQAPAQSITIINGPLIIIGQGPFPPIITGFGDIVQTATASIATMNQDRDQLKKVADATLVANAFREFVHVHQVLLNILIGKAGLFNTVPFIGQPVSSVLRQVEAVVDTIAFSLVDIVDPATQKSQISSDYTSLAGTLETAIGSYDGLSLKRAKREFVA